MELRCWWSSVPTLQCTRASWVTLTQCFWPWRQLGPSFSPSFLPYPPPHGLPSLNWITVPGLDGTLHVNGIPVTFCTRAWCTVSNHCAGMHAALRLASLHCVGTRDQLMESNGKALALGEEFQVELGGDLDKLSATVQVCLSPAMCSLSTSQARPPPYCS